MMSTLRLIAGGGLAIAALASSFAGGMARRATRDARQEPVTVKGRHSPRSIRVRPGIPVRLVLDSASTTPAAPKVRPIRLRHLAQPSRIRDPAEFTR